MGSEAAHIDDGPDKDGEKPERHPQILDIEALERRVHLAELHAREAEAEVRYLEAAAKRKTLKGERKDASRNKGRARKRRGGSGED